VLVLFDDWNSFFRSRSCRGAWAWPRRRATSSSASCCRVSCCASAGMPPRPSRWSAPPRSPWAARAGASRWLLALVDVQGTAEPARYFVPLAIAFEDDDEERARALAALAVTKVRQQAKMGVLADAMGDEPFCRAAGDGDRLAARSARRRRHACVSSRRTPTTRWSATRSTWANAIAPADHEQPFDQPAGRSTLPEVLSTTARRESAPSSKWAAS
jgi:hypothetical protein